MSYLASLISSSYGLITRTHCKPHVPDVTVTVLKVMQHLVERRQLKTIFRIKTSTILARMSYTDCVTYMICVFIFSNISNINFKI